MGISLPHVLLMGAGLSRPALDLNFLSPSETLDPRITFTRASGGTRFNSAGVLETVGNDVPRFDYDPVTLQPRGLLIEEQRTNLLTRSAEFNDSAWTKFNALISANAVTAPDGTLTADKLIATNVYDGHAVLTVPAVAIGSVVFSAFLKAAEFGFARIQLEYSGTVTAHFNLTNGTIVSASGGVARSITPVGNGWYYCSVTANASVTTANAIIFATPSPTNLTYTGDNTSGIYIWGAQAEQGAFPTAYIPTAGSQVTRAADNAVITGTNFSSWYNQTEGTFVLDFTPVTLNGVKRLLSGDNNSFFERSGGQISAWPPTVTANGVATIGKLEKAAMSYSSAGRAITLNGAAVKSDAGTVPSVTKLLFAADNSGGSVDSCYIRRVRYWPRRLPNSVLQRLTA